MSQEKIMFSLEMKPANQTMVEVIMPFWVTGPVIIIPAATSILFLVMKQVIIVEDRAITLQWVTKAGTLSVVGKVVYMWDIWQERRIPDVAIQ